MTPNILIAEDEQIVALDLKRRLEQFGYAVSGPAPSGPEAVQVAYQVQPDLVLMDIRLQGEMDGMHAAEEIQKGLDIPIVFLTAHAMPVHLERAKAVGSYGYLIKPFQERELQTTIEVVLARHRQDVEVRRLNQALGAEIARRQIAEKALQVRNAELEYRNAELDAFAYMVAHDLKGLLNTIGGFAEFLETDLSRLPTQNVLDVLARIRRTAHRMDRILEELLLLAGVSKQVVNLSVLDMGTIVDSALERIEDEIAQSGARIAKPARWPLVLGYGPWLEEVWFNYLTNAIRYGGTPPTLELGTTELGDGMVRFWVRDNGAGISEEDQVRLFIPFARLDRRSAGGTGLGLSIVKRIIERFGGEVGVLSTRGAGSEFYFTLARAEE